MKIVDVLVSSGLGGYYFDDLAAIKKGVKVDGMFLLGEPVTQWHKRVRQPGETMSIMLILDDGRIAFGDCAAIQYSGVVGRDPILLSSIYKPIVEKYVSPFLVGKELTSFREIAEQIDNLVDDEGNKLHTGIRYGASQAVLDAIAQSTGRIIAEVIRDEFGTTPRTTFIDVLAQSGDDRYIMADKMIMKKVPAIPQGLFNNVSKIGSDGSLLLEYVDWLRKRVEMYGDPDYTPTIHLDVYGTIGDIFDNQVDKVIDYLHKLEQHAYPFKVRVEHPVDLNERDAIIERMASVVNEIEKRGLTVEICADDWCNTLEDIKAFVDARAAHMVQIKAPDLGSIHNSIEAVIYCKNNGVKAFLGGSCNETDQSSRITVQAAMATNADLIYNKPGMAVDEGYMIVHNEIQRALTILKHRSPNLIK